MVDPHEQKLAKATLESRDLEFSTGLLFQKHLNAYFALLLFFCPLLVILYHQEMFLYFHLLFGVLLGTILRDFGWYRVIIRTRPFSLKVMDWVKVRRIAEGEQVD